jgi:hypothetical protein
MRWVARFIPYSTRNETKKLVVRSCAKFERLIMMICHPKRIFNRVRRDGVLMVGETFPIE